MEAAVLAQQGGDPLAVQCEEAQQDRREKVREIPEEGAGRLTSRDGGRRPRKKCCPIPIPHAQSPIFPRRLSRSRRCRSLAATLHDAVEKILERAVSPGSARQLPRPCDSPLFRGGSHWSFRGPGVPGNAGSLCHVPRAGFSGSPCANGHGAPVSVGGPCYWRPGLGGVTTDRRLRPLARRLLITSLPPGVAIRARKPWRRRRLRLLGW